MKKILLTSVTLFTIFFLATSFKSISDNYFKIGNKKWNLESAEIANESYDINSKFELDLISDTNKLSDAETFIWLSLTSLNTYNLADGIYEINENPLSEREPYRFNGSVFIKNKEIKIVAGSFSVEDFNDLVSVNMNFKLANGNILTGNYTGKFSFLDRRSNYE